jgi:hypothetical protein
MEPIGSCAIEGCAGRAEPNLSTFPICAWHFRKVVKKQDAERYAKEKDQQEKLRIRSAELDAQRDAWLREREQVYYIRTIDNVIKIGFTAHLLNRMKSYRLPLTHLLATEPGGRATERARHEQFAEYRYGRLREDFKDAPELMAHIALMRETHDTILTDDPYREQMIIPRLVATAEPDK